MIDLEKIGYNILEKDGHLEVTGGLTLTVKVGISSLAPDKKAMIEHAKKRIREKIWEMAYGHLKPHLEELKASPGDPEALDGLERAVGES